MNNILGYSSAIMLSELIRNDILSLANLSKSK